MARAALQAWGHGGRGLSGASSHPKTLAMHTHAHAFSDHDALRRRERMNARRKGGVGSVLSPLLGNIYLHYALDLWFETEVKPRLRGLRRERQLS